MDPSPVEHVVITVNAPTDKATPVPAPPAPKPPKSMMQKGLIALIIAPSIALVPLTLGVVLCFPSVVVGHTILRYTLSSSFGDAYRTIAINSSFIMGVVGGVVFAIYMITGTITVVAFLSIFYKIFFANALGWRRKPSERPQRPASKWKTFRTCVHEIISPLYLAFCIGSAGRGIIEYYNPALDMLDFHHVLAACMCGQYLMSLGEFLIRRLTRTTGQIALPTSEAEPLEGSGSSAEIVDANVENDVQDASEKV